MHVKAGYTLAQQHVQRLRIRGADQPVAQAKSTQVGHPRPSEVEPSRVYKREDDPLAGPTRQLLQPLLAELSAGILPGDMRPPASLRRLSCRHKLRFEPLRLLLQGLVFNPKRHNCRVRL